MLALLSMVISLSACLDTPRSPKRETVRQSTTTFTPSPAARQCLSQLGASKAGFTPLPDRYFGTGCSQVNTVSLSSLRTDRNTLALTNLGPVSCSVATSFASWAQYGVDRAARQIFGSPLARIETMGSYVCRNVAGTARRSAHASADAIDVAAFVLADGRKISVLNGWNSGTKAEREFLRVVHGSACKRFGTVLGPNYNAAHRDHFHVEAGHNGRPFCR